MSEAGLLPARPTHAPSPTDMAQACLDVLRDVLPDDGIMTCDVGAHTHLIGQLWPTPAPGTLPLTKPLVA